MIDALNQFIRSYQWYEVVFEMASVWLDISGSGSLTNE